MRVCVCVCVSMCVFVCVCVIVCVCVCVGNLRAFSSQVAVGSLEAVDSLGIQSRVKNKGSCPG